MSGPQQQYLSITGPLAIAPDTAGVTDINPQNTPLRSAWFSGTVTAGAFVTTGGGTPGPATFSQVTITQGTLVAQAAGLQQTVTWNNAAVTFTAQTLNVTDTASGAVSLLANWLVGGLSRFSVDKSGNLILAASASIGPATQYLVTGRSGWGSSADGLARFTNNANTGFTRLTLGLETNAFPAWAVSGSHFRARLGDDSDYTDVSMANLRVNNALVAGATGLRIGTTTQLTVGAAGAAAALPATPSLYLQFALAGALYVVPLYAKA